MKTTRYLPYRGKVVDLIQDQENLIIAVEHPEGANIGCYQFSLKTLDEDSLQLIETPDSLKGFARCGDNIYAYDVSGNLVLIHEGKSFLARQFGMIDFIVECAENTLLLADDEGKIIVYNPEKNKVVWAGRAPERITAVAADPTSQRFALGGASGMLHLYYAKTEGEELRYEKAKLYQQNDDELEQLHEQPITSLLFVTDEDDKLAVISASSDLRMFHTKVFEGKPQERSPQRNRRHQKQIIQMLPSAGQYFYSLGQDNSIKTRLKNNDKTSPSSLELADITAACLAQVPQKGNGGKFENQPFMIVAHGVNGSKRLSFLPIVSGLDTEKAEKAEKAEEAEKAEKENHKLQEAAFSVQGDLAWAWQQYGSKDVAVRKHVLDVLATWKHKEYGVLEALNKIVSMEEAPHLVSQTLEILDETKHPSLPYFYEKMLDESRTSTVLEAFQFLRGVYGKYDIYPLQKAFTRSGIELRKAAMLGFAELARAKDLVALDILISCLGSSEEEASLAFQLICGQGSHDAVLPGIEGIETTLRASSPVIITESLELLYHHGLLQDPKSEGILLVHREHSTEKIRTKAFLVSLLRERSLGDLLRSEDEAVHKQLCEIEHRNSSAKEREAAMQQQPSSAPRLDAGGIELLQEMVSCSQSDIASFGALVQAKLGDISAISLLMMLTQEKSAEIRQRAARGLSFFVEKKMVQQMLQSLLLSDEDQNVRTICFEVLYKTYKAAGTHLDLIRVGQDSKFNDVRMVCVARLQDEIEAKLKATKKLEWSDHAFPDQLKTELELLERVFYNSATGDEACKQGVQTFRTHNLVHNDHLRTREYLLGIGNASVYGMIFQEISDEINKDWVWNIMGQALDHNDEAKAFSFYDGLLRKFGITSSRASRAKMLEEIVINLIRAGMKSRNVEIKSRAFQTILQAVDGIPWVIPLLLDALLDQREEIRDYAYSKHAKDKLQKAQYMSAAVLKALGSEHDVLHEEAEKMMTKYRGCVTEEIVDAWIALCNAPNSKRDIFFDPVWSKAVKLNKARGLVDSFKEIHGENEEEVLRLIARLGTTNADWVVSELAEFSSSENQKMADAAFRASYQYSMSKGKIGQFLDIYLKEDHARLTDVVDLMIGSDSEKRLEILKRGLSLKDPELQQKIFSSLMADAENLSDEYLIALFESTDRMAFRLAVLKELCSRSDSGIFVSHAAKILSLPKPEKSVLVGIWRNTLSQLLDFVAITPNQTLFDALKKLELNCRRNVWSENDLRIKAIRAMGWVAPETEHDYLKELLATQKDVRKEAALALCHVGDVAGLQVVYDEFFEAKTCAAAIITCGDDAAPFVLRALKENADLSRWLFLAWALQKSITGGAIDVLSAALTSVNEKVRLQAARLMASSHSQREFGSVVIDLMSEGDFTSKNPLSGINFSDVNSWVSISDLLLSAYRHPRPKNDATLSNKEWSRFSLILGSPNARTRFLAAELFMDYFSGRAALEDTQKQLKKFSVLDVTIEAFSLFGDAPNKETGKLIAFGALAGIVRQGGSASIRRNALRDAVGLSIGKKELELLQVTLYSPNASLRQDAFTWLLEKNHRDVAIDGARAAAKKYSDRQLALLLISHLVQGKNLQTGFSSKDFSPVFQLMEEERGIVAEVALEFLLYNPSKGYEALSRGVNAIDENVRNRSIDSVVASIEQVRSIKEDDSKLVEILLSVVRKGLPAQQERAAENLVRFEENEVLPYIYRRLERGREKKDIVWAMSKLEALKPDDASARLLQRLSNDTARIVPLNQLFPILKKLDQNTSETKELLLQNFREGSSFVRKASFGILQHYTNYWRSAEEIEDEDNDFKIDTALITQMLNLLLQFSDYANIHRLLGLIGLHKDKSEELDQILGQLACLNYNEQIKDLRLEAVKVCAKRYKEWGDSTALREALEVNVKFDLVPKEITEYQLVAGCGLLEQAKIPLSEDDNFAFRKMRALVDDSVYSTEWRKQALGALGRVRDMRFVPSLLALAGVDVNGKKLPPKDIDQSLLKTAIALLGGYSQAPQAQVIFQVLLDRLKQNQYKKPAVVGLGNFVDDSSFHIPLVQSLEPMITNDSSPELITTVSSIYKALDIQDLKDTLENKLEAVLLGSQFKQVYTFLKEIRSDSDIRVDLTAYKEGYAKCDDKIKKNLLKNIKAHGSISALIDVLTIATEKKRLAEIPHWEAAVTENPDLTFTVLIEAIQKEIKNGFVLFDSLKVLLKSKIAELSTSQKEQIAGLATNVRENWLSCQRQINQGIQSAVKKREGLEKVWDEVLDLLTIVNHGKEEMEATLMLVGLPYSLLAEACDIYAQIGQPSVPVLQHLFVEYPSLRGKLLNMIPMELYPQFLKDSLGQISVFHNILRSWHAKFQTDGHGRAAFVGLLQQYLDLKNPVILSEVAMLEEGSFLVDLYEKGSKAEQQEILKAMKFATSKKVQSFLSKDTDRRKIYKKSLLREKRLQALGLGR